MTTAMEYVSTRGRTPPVGFREAVLAGLADDGGLLVPARIPSAHGLLADWSKLPFAALAFEVMRLYADLPEDELMALIERAYGTWSKGPARPQAAAILPVMF